MTRRRYYETSDLQVVTRVTDTGLDKTGPWIVTEETVAHVKGGGQKGDRGTINGIAFHDVVGSEGRNGPARHYVDCEPPFTVGDTVTIQVDAQWRQRQATLHDGGHLTAAVGEVLVPGLKAVSGHHYDGESRVEFIGDLPPNLDDFGVKLETAINEAVRSDLLIRIVGDPFENRAVQIGDYPPVPCGGTHPKSTSELGRVEIRSVKAKGGKLRVSYEVVATR